MGAFQKNGMPTYISMGIPCFEMPHVVFNLFPGYHTNFILFKIMSICMLGNALRVRELQKLNILGSISLLGGYFQNPPLLEHPPYNSLKDLPVADFELAISG